MRDEDRLLDGRYRLAGRIGAGGMGEVWRAHDEHLRRPVAVKLVTALGHDRDPTVAARFVREARAAARLSSPYIVTVYELGAARTDGGVTVPYLVMELVDGRPLDRLIHGPEGLPALADVARWTGQMCRALSTAHSAGVVHRDVKPANVLVTAGDTSDAEDGSVKVLDFGIARFLDGTGAPTVLTAAGSLVGTPAYMSPEQARGDVPVDGRGDLYSLGCVLHELLTGRPPFEASAWHVLLRRHLDESAPPPSRLRAGLPHGWDELVLALLAKDPADRPRTATEVRDRLAALAAGPPPPPPRRGAFPSQADAEAETRTAPEPSAPVPWTPTAPPSVPAPAPAPPAVPPAVPESAPRPVRPESSAPEPVRPRSEPAPPPVFGPPASAGPGAGRTVSGPGGPPGSVPRRPDEASAGRSPAGGGAVPSQRGPRAADIVPAGLGAAVALFVTVVLLPWWVAVVVAAVAVTAGARVAARRWGLFRPGKHQ
ncbi:serine/threonine-protein kinase [Streptomyces sp. NPDC005907]|uniref:serine/threonine-protein kinase n=1 Tax=Streptomyces sp. NPDC005907 TaxID=3154571 RepID=UPI0033D843A6